MESTDASVQSVEDSRSNKAEKLLSKHFLG